MQWLRLCLPMQGACVQSLVGETKIPHAPWPKNQNIKQKQYCNKFSQDLKKWSTSNKILQEKKETEKSVLQSKAELMQRLPQNALSGSRNKHETEAGSESACSEPHTHACTLGGVRNPHLPNAIGPPGNKGPVVPGLPLTSGDHLQTLPQLNCLGLSSFQINFPFLFFNLCS